MELQVRNVNEALQKGVQWLALPGVRNVSPRGAATLEWPTPWMTSYAKPQERVLFCPQRDANPFFHFFEALWMLYGRDDVKFVSYFVKRMAEYADDGVTDQGAYGARWRKSFGLDQLDVLIEHLREQPDSRRAVLQMWHTNYDLEPRYRPHNPGEVYTIGGLGSKDVPCNTTAYFKIRDGALRLTVCNRSNDMIWGAYGANAVQFSTLQEYVANKLGVEVGPYYQMSDSLHVYTGGEGGEKWEALRATPERDFADPYASGEVEPYPLGAGGEDWDSDLRGFFIAFDFGAPLTESYFRTDWWKKVAMPLWLAWKYHKDKDDVGAKSWANGCVATDWRRAAVEWLERRAK